MKKISILIMTLVFVISMSISGFAIISISMGPVDAVIVARLCASITRRFYK